MSSIDPRVRELFTHVRRAIDIVEDLMLRPSTALVPQHKSAIGGTTADAAFR